jgi:hypothetical protein
MWSASEASPERPCKTRGVDHAGGHIVRNSHFDTDRLMFDPRIALSSASIGSRSRLGRDEDNVEQPAS